MAKKKRATSNSRAKTRSVKLKGSRRVQKRAARGQITAAVGKYLLPMLITAVLLGATVFLAVSGYQTATASSFFGLRTVDVRGNERTPPEDIKRVVSASVEKTGVWNADLGEIRMAIEKFPFVKSAAVSRMLPGGIRVNVTERVPAAVVRLSSGNYLVDGDGTLLAIVKDKSSDFPFVLQGWDEAKTEKAGTDNLARLKVYKKMLDEWKQFDLVSRVKEVNLSNPRDPVAVIEDSGSPVAITLGRDGLGKSLRAAIEAVSGKGGAVKEVNAEGISPVLQYRDQ
jgi:cell division septal protein FtsQ